MQPVLGTRSATNPATCTASAKTSYAGRNKPKDVMFISFTQDKAARTGHLVCDKPRNIHYECKEIHTRAGTSPRIAGGRGAHTEKRLWRITPSGWTDVMS